MKPSPPPVRPPLFALIFISLFGFIGLTVIVFLWSADGFGAPPLFFKVFGSFIGLGFMALGFGLPLSALKQARSKSSATQVGNFSSHNGYKCPNCGASLDREEVSPSGDVKCSYCARWYNIHAQS